MASRPLRAPLASPGRQRPSRIAVGTSIVSVLLLGALVLVAVLVPLPYLAVEPGSAREVAGLITIDGADPPFPTAGSVAFTTVTQREATLADLLRGWIDDDIEIVPKQLILGDKTEEENDRYNAALMDTSKLAAETVALERLGYPVAIVTSGSVVRRTIEGAPAEAVLQLDDVIVGVDGEPVDRLNELRDLLQVGGPGATHTLTVERPAGTDQRIEVPITTVAAEDDPTRAVIGIEPEERIVGCECPFQIGIRTDRVKGPSAGLAFTLAIIDVLTEGELTGGRKVAVTGTIDFAGNVGPVGGGVQKAAAVRNAGYEAFLVPPQELELVRRAVGDDLTVIAVGTLQEALDALASLGGDLSSLPPVGAAPAP